ncbi:MAG: dihydrodipicolinate synthase family protein [Anaerolineales bacterium]
MSNNPSLHGIFPPIPTPFRSDESIDLDALQANLSAWNELPLSGYVVGGSNGEFVHLDDLERTAVLETARQSIPSDRPLIAGTGTTSTFHTIRLTEAAAEAGADAALVVSPSYYRSLMSERALIAHYTAVADASPLPIILYNVPANTGLNIPERVVLELAQHDRIVGMKDSGGDLVRMGAILAGAGPGFQVLAGSGGFILPALTIGAVGAVPALGNIAGPQLAELHAEFESGNLEKARSIQLRMIEPNRAVTSQFGVPGLKAALDMLGLVGGWPRRPLLPLNSEEYDQLAAVLRSAGILNEGS